MFIIVRQSAQPAERRREYWNWCFENGFVATEVADPIVVDTEAGTATIQRWLPVAQPGDPDFPELRRDEFNQPLTETETVRLIAPVPSWMLTEAGRRLAA